MHVCPLCKSEYTTLRALSCHRSKSHKDCSQEEFARLVYCLPSIPQCQCGCQQPTNFISLELGWSKWLRGHNGFSEEARITAVSNSIKFRKQHGSWNKNKTKLTDQRIDLMSQKVYSSLQRMSIKLTKYKIHYL